MMIWSLIELSREIGTCKNMLQSFIDTLEFPEPEGGFTEKQADQLKNLWETTGASLQYAETNKLTPNVSWKEHMQSNDWDIVRRDAIARSKNRCRICGTKEGPKSVHHSHYEDMGDKKEERFSVVALCEKCHKAADILRKSNSGGKMDRLGLIQLLQMKG